MVKKQSGGNFKGQKHQRGGNLKVQNINVEKNRMEVAQV
jgi:hypothetical protein